MCLRENSQKHCGDSQGPQTTIQWTEVKSQDFLRDQWGQSATLEPRTAKSTFTQGGRTEGHRGAAGGVRHFGREQQGLRHSRNTKELTAQTSHTHRGKGGQPSVTRAAVHRGTEFTHPEFSGTVHFKYSIVLSIQ